MTVVAQLDFDSGFASTNNFEADSLGARGWEFYLSANAAAGRVALECNVGSAYMQLFEIRPSVGTATAPVFLSGSLAGSNIRLIFRDNLLHRGRFTLFDEPRPAQGFAPLGIDNMRVMAAGAGPTLAVNSPTVGCHWSEMCVNLITTRAGHVRGWIFAGGMGQEIIPLVQVAGATGGWASTGWIPGTAACELYVVNDDGANPNTMSTVVWGRAAY